MNGITHPTLYHTLFRRTMGKLCIFHLQNWNLKRTHTNASLRPKFSCGTEHRAYTTRGHTHTYLEMLKIFATSNTYKHTHQHRNNAFRSQEQRILQKEIPPLQIICVWNIWKLQTRRVQMAACIYARLSYSCSRSPTNSTHSKQPITCPPKNNCFALLSAN